MSAAVARSARRARIVLQGHFRQATLSGHPADQPGIRQRGRRRGRQAAATKIIDAVGFLVVEFDPAGNGHAPARARHRCIEAAAIPGSHQHRAGLDRHAPVRARRHRLFLAEFQDRLDPDLRLELDKSFWPAIYKACARSVNSCQVAPTHAVFRSPADRRHYHADHQPRRHHRRQQCDVHDQLRADRRRHPEQTSGRRASRRMFTALNMSHRFRWEIIDPYKDVRPAPGFRRAPGTDPPARRRQRRRQWRRRTGSRLGGDQAARDRVAQSRGQRSRCAAGRFRPRCANPGECDVRQLADHAPAPGAGGPRRRRPGLCERARGDRSGNVEFISLAAKRLGELVQADACHPDAVREAANFGSYPECSARCAAAIAPSVGKRKSGRTSASGRRVAPWPSWPARRWIQQVARPKRLAGMWSW